MDKCLPEIFSWIMMCYRDGNYHASNGLISIVQTKFSVVVCGS